MFIRRELGIKATTTLPGGVQMFVLRKGTSNEVKDDNERTVATGWLTAEVWNGARQGKEVMN